MADSSEHTFTSEKATPWEADDGLELAALAALEPVELESVELEPVELAPVELVEPAFVPADATGCGELLEHPVKAPTVTTMTTHVLNRFR